MTATILLSLGIVLSLADIFCIVGLLDTYLCNVLDSSRLVWSYFTHKTFRHVKLSNEMSYYSCHKIVRFRIWL